MAGSKARVLTATIARHSILPAVLPVTTQLWNLAISSLCQEPQTLWAPTFHSSLKGPHCERRHGRWAWEVGGTQGRIPR